MTISLRVWYIKESMGAGSNTERVLFRVYVVGYRVYVFGFMFSDSGGGGC